MLVIALEMGFHGGSRRRAGTEFDMDLQPDGTLPSWVVAADDQSRGRVASDAVKRSRDNFNAMLAAAGPKRGGQPGVRPVNTGLADATPASAPLKAVTPSWYTPSKVEQIVAGVEAVPASAPDIDSLPSLA